MNSYGKKDYSFFSLAALGLICLLSFALMLWASLGDSAVMDELAHIPSGYGYASRLDYRLNPEHPPLVKALAELPVLFLNPIFPVNDPAWTTGVNGQWQMGTDFLYQSGNDADIIVRISRIGPMLLTILTIILVYIFSAELLGRRWVLLPTFLFALSPTVLAHGHYVTTDVGAAFGVILATYFFLKFLSTPSKRRILYSGLTLGIAELAKFSAVLLIPYFLILIVFFFISTTARDWKDTEPALRLKRFSKRAWHHARSVVIIFVIGYVLIVYPVYFLFTSNYPIQKQTSDTEFILGSFADGPTPAGHLCKPARCPADFDIWMTKNPTTRPYAEYLLGVLMVLQRSSGGNTSYFLGRVSAAGSPEYFPVVYLLKESLPVLVIVFLALILALAAITKRVVARKRKVISYFFVDYLGTSFTEFSLLVFVVFYWAYSIRSQLNIGFRHLFPIMPLVYILAAGAWKKWLASQSSEEFRFGLARLLFYFKSFLARTLKSALLAFLLVWFLGETVAAAPYFLSYFNEFGGGVWNGYHYVTDSNYDWGQDLLRLRDFVKAHPEIDKIAVDYFGGGNPKYYLGAKEVDWSSSKGNPSGQNIHWLAVSVNTLEGAIQPLVPGQSRNPEDEYGWLTSRPQTSGMGNVPPPDFRAGTSIFIYKL